MNTTIVTVARNTVGSAHLDVGDIIIIDIGQNRWERWMHRGGNDPVATALWHRAVRRGRVIAVDSIAVRIEELLQH